MQSCTVRSLQRQKAGEETGTGMVFIPVPKNGQVTPEGKPLDRGNLRTSLVALERVV